MNPYGGDPSNEWPAEPDVAGLLENRWHGHPFRQFPLKVHSRRDLACDYCYVYMTADQSRRSRPMVMAPELVEIAARRISEHARSHSLPSVRVILHGGEPLLAGREYLTKIVESIRGEAGPNLRVDAAVQTNGVLPDEEIMHAFDRLGVRVGVSLDGGPRGNDRSRRYADGRGSYEAPAGFDPPVARHGLSLRLAPLPWTAAPGKPGSGGGNGQACIWCGYGAFIA
ncbi:radical SAM protein [Sphaerisporangium sp. NPDC004334]